MNKIITLFVIMLFQEVDNSMRMKNLKIYIFWEIIYINDWLLINNDIRELLLNEDSVCSVCWVERRPVNQLGLTCMQAECWELSAESTHCTSAVQRLSAVCACMHWVSGTQHRRHTLHCTQIWIQSRLISYFFSINGECQPYNSIITFYFNLDSNPIESRYWCQINGIW